jgi:anaerobic carbon-monoxide dehydrogenase iron sulfur subunit
MPSPTRGFRRTTMISANLASKPMPASDLPKWSGEIVESPAAAQSLVVIPRNCVGCRTCELACSFAHARDGVMGRSRIRVHPVAPERYVQITCLQCVNAACAKVCPTQAISRDPLTNALVVVEARCVGCGLCQTACPFGHIHLENETRLAHKCDLCGGHPACASFCPHRALEMR